MLRSDLNHHQGRVTREFDRVSSKPDRNLTEDVIEYLVANMPHVQFQAKPSTKAAARMRRHLVPIARGPGISASAMFKLEH